MRTTARTRDLALVCSLLALAALGCGSSCTDLQAICDRCQDPNKKASCEQSVDADDDDLCEQNIDSYGTICP